jgi:DNA-directed RNA polymerase sigma subunit (sigma70/sigma32)
MKAINHLFPFKGNEMQKRNRLILLYRFGFFDDVEHTLDETGDVFNVTRERIRQIVEHSLNKLREYMGNYKVKRNFID